MYYNKVLIKIKWLERFLVHYTQKQKSKQKIVFTYFSIPYSFYTENIFCGMGSCCPMSMHIHLIN